MTLAVRDEADILEANLAYHLNQGVDFVVATDNGSRDGSAEILDRYAHAGYAHVIREEADEFTSSQSRWVTRMARLAATDFGADWVINNDADEFWWPLEGTLAGTFAAVPDGFDLIFAPRPEFVARPDGDGPFYERLVVRETHSRVAGKVAHRGAPDAVVPTGSHRVARESQLAAAERGQLIPPKAVTRGAGEASLDVAGEGMVPAPYWPIRILHFPLRGYDHYLHRVEIVLDHSGGPLGARRRELRRAREEGRLAELYGAMVMDDDAIAPEIASGRLTVDRRLAEYMRRCPDPLATPREELASGRPSVPPADEADRRELEADAVAALARMELRREYRIQQAVQQAEKALAGVAKAEARAEKAERLAEDAAGRAERAERHRSAAEAARAEAADRLAAIESTRWWRVRERAARILRRGG
jgi:hypothetical protein